MYLHALASVCMGFDDLFPTDLKNTPRWKATKNMPRKQKKKERKFLIMIHDFENQYKL